ncbi:Diguanylate cyclase DosC [Cupriavidus yeoncheonensis]|uniref:Diguanylate cyclase DosC n=1 Tax=Cupriavidus yeoncheonensis TaxID=1462994 RepID=A0A916IZ51_9BURK|nr:diguanylate cyclase [Cupriavidus yeoncheonensis]CAG2152927.1 Diguanylate cyclase DosC [Cupriavidus yeoncheonensis]
MLRLSAAQLEQDWRAILGDFTCDTLGLVRSFAVQYQRELANHFYDEMLADPVASRLISHDQVKSRLHDSMMKWVAGVFLPGPKDDLRDQIARLVQIGEVHARIDVPVHLVLRGARKLKDGFSIMLRDGASLGTGDAIDAVRLMSSVIDLAMEMMSFAYSSSHDRNSRAEEAYRLTAVVQNVAAEQERQRAALLDWENVLMFELAVNTAACDLPRVHASEFGMWFRHKGMPAFEGAAESQVILQAMNDVDGMLLPTLEAASESGSGRPKHLRMLRMLTSSIGFNLDLLFKQANELESGRDVLTRLLNRKFLPVVMSKEVKYARQRGTNFAVLAIDIDYFKDVNDSYGHEAGDLVLQELATRLINASRGGDYTFRLGGEEFLMVLVDVTAENGRHAAEKLRCLVEEAPFSLRHGVTLSLTISIGLAFNDGHPDYQRTMNQADEALYEAKRSGRNCVVVASPAAAPLH